jgi:hypothetical protein
MVRLKGANVSRRKRIDALSSAGVAGVKSMFGVGRAEAVTERGQIASIESFHKDGVKNFLVLLCGLGGPPGLAGFARRGWRRRPGRPAGMARATPAGGARSPPPYGAGVTSTSDAST